MKNNTATAPVSSANDDQDPFIIREANAEKAILRTGEMAERCRLIGVVAKAAFPGIMAEHSLGDAVSLARRLDDAVDAVETEFKVLKGVVSFLKEVSLPSRLDREKCTTFNTDRERVTRTTGIFASIRAEQQEAAYKWLRANKLGDLIKETVNASSLSAAAKEKMRDGYELPDEIFGLHTKDGVSITRKDKKAK